MIRHVVAFTWTPEATPERVQQIADELTKLAGGLPAVKAYTCGPDAGINSGNADFAVVADFDDEADYLSYRDHPEHQEILKRLIVPVVAQRSAIQFKF
jgi:hypothetical protein